MKLSAFPLVAAALAFLLTGCVDHEVVVVHHRPAAVVVVDDGGYPPYPGAIWVPAHRVWRYDHWVWIRGHWRRR